MKFLITEDRIQKLFNDYMEKVAKNLIISKTSEQFVSLRYPDSGEFDTSFFDIEPDYEKYELDYDSDEENYDEYEKIIWTQCEFIEELEGLFSLSEDETYRLLLKWAQKKYDPLIKRITCQN